MTAAFTPPAPPDETGFDTRAFRTALGHFPTGVTVMTAAAGGRRIGVTVNSFSALSLDPPLILWSIIKASSSYAVFEAASHFAVNILAHDQIALSQRFARPAEDRFHGIGTGTGAGGAPLLPGTCGLIEYERHQILDGGDHWILIGRVLSFATEGHAPLLFHKGAYALASPHPDQPPRG
ncbi:flavin reductase family protein [Pseudogemmobacter bohemicus]|uniref:flavin reductase family protein n=1 Tax=Pseudogemmobacter bohemicus TaxID=2250708 RepID=UPI000DD31933|nr:flavin reductase family protein [Pseudogemmobacter bohemicus]